jgi:hypothetical protein
MMNDPTKSAKAVLLPKLIAPKAMQNIEQKINDSTGQLSRRLTLEKNGANGVALSRARHHQIRLN